MPAIQLSKLTAEIDQLVKTIDRPAEFHIQLRELFERYANRSFRHGDVVKKNIHIPQYNLPSQVIHKISQALKNNLVDTENTLELANMLRQDPYFEIRVIAINLISALPAEPAEALQEIITEWAQQTREKHLLVYLFDNGAKPFRNRHPSRWLALIEEWLEKGSEKTLLGLTAVHASITDPDFQFIPNIYKIITSPLMRVPKGYYAQMLEIVLAMVERVPSETSFFLQQILLRDPSSETVRLIRRVIPSFPAEWRQALRKTVMEFGEPGD